MSGVGSARSQTADSTGEPQVYGDILVTAAPGDRTAMASAASVSILSTETITRFAPRSEADVLRLIPGIRAEATAGPGGNSNITVRGLPLAAGGAKYVQLQEDGLPVIEYGDIAFGNNDFWLRFDATVEQVQAVRGGAASTYASQAPGAVINYVSATGERAAGRIALSTGIGYNEKRLDFAYGRPLGGGWRFHVGGFTRRGSGPRDVPYRALEGYQVKANVTHEFADGSGFARLYFKRLDDRAPTYTNAPFGVRLKGNKITGYYPLPGFDAREQSNFSTLNLRFPTVNADGTVKVTDANREGIHVLATSLGAQLRYEASERLSIDERFHSTWQHGRFSAPFYGAPTRVGDIVGTMINWRTVAQLRYANGPLAGQIAPADLPVNRFPNLYTDMNAMDHLANDLAVNARLPLGQSEGAGELRARAGWYHSRQTIAMDWHWNARYSVGIGENPGALDLFDTTGAKLTDEGVSGYNRAFGGCCARRYDLAYTDDAAYGELRATLGPIELDASARRDHIRARGRFFGASPTPVSVDVNGDGELSLAEQRVILPSATPQRIDYSLSYTSWSFGATARLGENASLFARASKGHRANADRVVSDFAGAFDASGALTSVGRAVVLNPVTQQELGVRVRDRMPQGHFGMTLTAFRSQATEYNFDLTTQQQTFQDYSTWGLEWEGEMRSGPLSLSGWVVYTHSRIERDLIFDNAGNTPRATPELMAMLAPALRVGPAQIGFTLLAQSRTYAQDDNRLAQRGFATVNAFARLAAGHGVDLSLEASNLFNAWDQAGRLDQGSVAGLAATGAIYGVPYAATNRVGLGRTVSASLAWSF